MMAMLVNNSTYFLFLILLASPAVSQELGKDEDQFEARLQVLAYDADIIAERLLEGMWNILPYIFR